MSILVRSKLKYRIGGQLKRTACRTRTGPRCCHENCPSTRKKSKKRVKRELPKKA